MPPGQELRYRLEIRREAANSQVRSRTCRRQAAAAWSIVRERLIRAPNCSGRVMRKAGHPLSEIEEVPARLATTLREDLSVTTAEEFLGLAMRYASNLQGLLDLDSEGFLKLVDHVRGALSPTEVDELCQETSPEYPYMTGHDAPADGKNQYDAMKGDDDD